MSPIYYPLTNKFKNKPENVLVPKYVFLPLLSLKVLSHIDTSQVYNNTKVVKIFIVLRDK